MAEKAEFLTVEVGSTITKANAFVVSGAARSGSSLPSEDGCGGFFVRVGQGFAPTSVSEGDVTIGIGNALKDLSEKSSVDLDSAVTFVNSSAAGGLRITVHGLTYNMTARAAKEAALGAGAIIKNITAGLLGRYELDEVLKIDPNIVILAGGVDYGARDAVVENARALAGLNVSASVIYAGNVALANEVCDIFASAGKKVLVAPNVFPDVDILNVEPLRKLIQDEFSINIVKAPGMEKVRDTTHHPIYPTPAVVLRATRIFAQEFGDVLAVDVGGATTDVHSVTNGSPEYAAKMIEPEPEAKRTVEGDLGVFVNARNIIDTFDDDSIKARESDVKAIPAAQGELEMTAWLCRKAVETAVRRHAGTLADLYTPSGRRQIVKGKDLTAVKYLIGTGGALAKIAGGEVILKSVCRGPEKYLLPKPETKIVIDRDYLFSAMGTLAEKYPEIVKNTFIKWMARYE